MPYISNLTAQVVLGHLVRQISSQVIRDHGIEDELTITYTVTSTSLELEFDFSGMGHSSG